MESLGGCQVLDGPRCCTPTNEKYDLVADDLLERVDNVWAELGGQEICM